MTKKEKKASDQAEEIHQIKTVEPTTINPASSESITQTKTTPKKASKNTKSEKDERNTSKKASSCSKKNKSIKETPQVKKIQTTEQIYLQYAGKELSSQVILDKIKQIWVESGNKLTTLQTLNLYIKPEENTAYYVINESDTGKIDL